jgi:DME family drug/metabolite transporter
MYKFIKSGSIAVVVAALLWSVDGVLRIHLQTSLPAPVIVFYEHLFGFILLLPIILSSLKAFKQLTRKQWYAITGVAFLSGAVGTIAYTAALGRVQFIPFSVVVLLQQLNPIFAIGTAAALLREPLTRRFYGLTALALVAAYMTAFPHLSINLSTGSGTLVGALLAVGAAAAWGTSTAFSKYALEGTSSLHITSLRFGITPIFALLFVLFSGSGQALGQITWSQFGYLAAITFSTGLVALLIYYYGLKRVLASRAAVLELAWPASSVLVSYFWYHQHFTWTQALGSLILVGVVYKIVQETKSEPASTVKIKRPKAAKRVAKATA